MDALKECIPIHALYRITVSFLEPLQWHHFIPNEDERFALADEVEITITPTPWQSRDYDSFLRNPLNSPAALFGYRAVRFESKTQDWCCTAAAGRIRWSKRMEGKDKPPRAHRGPRWFPCKIAPYDKTHRDGDEPAIIRQMMNETVELQWWVNGVLGRRDDRPSLVANGSVCWYDHGRLHRRGRKPAIMHWGGRYEWWVRGQVRPDLAGKKMPTGQEVAKLVQYVQDETSLARWAN